MKNKQYVIFDLDGTLVDSFPTVVNACKRVFAEYAPAEMPDDACFETYRFQDMEKVFKELASKAAMSVAAFRSYYDLQYRKDYINGTTVIAKQLSLLNTAKSQGLGVIILTNKRQELAEQVCTLLLGSNKIDVIIGRLDSYPIKPRGCLMPLLSRGITPSQCLRYYGDSETDRQTAQLLNIDYINTKKY